MQTQTTTTARAFIGADECAARIARLTAHAQANGLPVTPAQIESAVDAAAYVEFNARRDVKREIAAETAAAVSARTVIVVPREQAHRLDVEHAIRRSRDAWAKLARHARDAHLVRFAGQLAARLAADPSPTITLPLTVFLREWEYGNVAYRVARMAHARRSRPIANRRPAVAPRCHGCLTRTGDVDLDAPPVWTAAGVIDRGCPVCHAPDRFTPVPANDPRRPDAHLLTGVQPCINGWTVDLGNVAIVAD